MRDYKDLKLGEERRVLGQFYTPRPIAEFIVRWTVRSGADRVLDGGCGPGIFLVEAYKRLLMLKFNKEYGKSYPACEGRINEHQEVLDNLYGVDIDASAVQLASLHLMHMAPYCPTSKPNIEVGDFFSLSKIFTLAEEGFDAVIGNPPYTRWTEIPVATKKLIRRSVGDLMRRYDLNANIRIGKAPGIYVYWILHATKHQLKTKGRLGVIIPNAWLQTAYGVNFGKFLLDNFKLKALIDIPRGLFDALISNVILLAEKEPSGVARRSNEVLLVRIPYLDGKLTDEEFEVRLAEILKCIEDAITPGYEFDRSVLERCRDAHGIWYRFVRQHEIPEDRMWISLFFPSAQAIANVLETHPLMIRAEEWFKPRQGNSVWSIWALDHGSRSGLGAKDFFYFSENKILSLEAKVQGFKDVVVRYLAPAITASRYVKTFTFTEEDWEKIRVMERREKGKVIHPGNAWMLVLHERREMLPQQLQEYIRWGETECRTKIRVPCGEAEACRVREEFGEPYFYGWYDLGGYVPTPIMTIYHPLYHPQFFLAKMSNLITYPAIITLIPRVKIKIGNTIYDPIEYNKIYGDIVDNVKPDIVLDEVEVKALLAYLNSTFNWVWLEQNAGYLAGGPLYLGVNVVERMPIPSFKKVAREYAVELAELFDRLESVARLIIGTSTSLSKEGEEEEGGEKLRMFKELRAVFREIDGKVAEILGISIDVDELWRHAWEMMERRVKGLGRKAMSRVKKVRLATSVEGQEVVRERNRVRVQQDKVASLIGWL